MRAGQLWSWSSADPRDRFSTSFASLGQEGTGGLIPPFSRANISIETSEVLRRNRRVGFAAEDAGVTRLELATTYPHSPPRAEVAFTLREPNSPLGSPRHFLLFAAADAAASSYLLRQGALM